MEVRLPRSEVQHLPAEWCQQLRADDQLHASTQSSESSSPASGLSCNPDSVVILCRGLSNHNSCARDELIHKRRVLMAQNLKETLFVRDVEQTIRLSGDDEDAVITDLL